MPNLRRGLHLIGHLIAAMAVLFVLQRLWLHREVLTATTIPPLVWWVMGLGTLLYGASGFLLSAAWSRLLHGCGEYHLSVRQCHGVYGRSQLGKYLPGNIFHFVGRHVLSRSLDCAHIKLVCALTHETLLLVVVAAIIAMPGMLWFTLPIRWLSWLPPLGLACAVGLLLAWGRSAGGTSLARSLPVMLGSLALPMLGYGLFLHLSGIILIAVGSALQGEIPPHAYLILSAYVLAWLAGFVVPGAPAGLGLRELVLLALLTPLWGETAALLTASLFRLVTVGGDVVFFLLALAWVPRLGIEIK